MTVNQGTPGALHHMEGESKSMWGQRLRIMIVLGVLAALMGGSSLRASAASYTQTAMLMASDGEAVDNLGTSVAVSANGTIALAGTPNHNLAKGAVYVFTLSGGRWNQTAKLTDPDAPPGSNFGFAVALSSDGMTALVGEPWRNPGFVYVFTSSAGTWRQSAQLSAPDLAFGDVFGSALALSADGTTALIGAAGQGGYFGAAYVFTNSGGTWHQSAKLPKPDQQYNAFGTSVALSSDGSTALVGAETYNNRGTAYLFTLSGGNWSNSAQFLASDGAYGDHFGSSVALSSDGMTALVGAFLQNSDDIGAAYVFTSSGGAWRQSAKLAPSDGELGNRFGSAVALSSNGTTAFVGSPYRNGADTAYGAGAVYVFASSNGTWGQTGKLTASDETFGNAFGLQVTLSSDGTTLLVAALGHESSSGAPNAGAVYVFTAPATADTTPPVITPSVSCTSPGNPSPGAYPWCQGTLTVTWTVTDAESTPTPGAGCAPTTISTDTPATGTTLTCTATSQGGSATKSVTVYRDGTAPTVAITTPAEGAAYALGEAKTASYSCADAASGPATCAGTVANGAPLDTSAVGARTFTVSAADTAGNSATRSVTYSVTYRICVLFDQSKAYRAGSTVPVKLQLCDSTGRNLSAAGLVVSAGSLTKVDSTASSAVEDAGSANPDSNFRYDAALAGYIYNLSTAGLTTGTWQLSFTVAGDPVPHTVQFDVR